MQNLRTIECTVGTKSFCAKIKCVEVGGRNKKKQEESRLAKCGDGDGNDATDTTTIRHWISKGNFTQQAEMDITNANC